MRGGGGVLQTGVSKSNSHHEVKPWLKPVFVGLCWYLQGNQIIPKGFGRRGTRILGSLVLHFSRVVLRFTKNGQMAHSDNTFLILVGAKAEVAA